MEAIREKHGFGTVDRALRYLRIRMASRPQTRALEGELNELRMRLQGHQASWEEAREERVAATAELEICDSDLDEAVSRLSKALLADMRADDPRYQTLFSLSPSQAMKDQASPAQSRFVRSLLSVLSGTDYAAYKSHAETIARLQARVEEVEASRETFYQAESLAQVKRRAVLAEARRFYNQAYPRLLLIFPGQKRLVESYFASLTERSREVSAPPESTPPASQA